MNNKNEKVIALLGQPNSGKSSLFNLLTGSHQHVGNWPGKTVEKKEGTFTRNGNRYLVADLPGSYSLSAESAEEIITRDYIQSGKPDLVCILADASQLRRSLYMLADFAGNDVPAVLLLNMMDVAKDQGIHIDCDLLSKRLGIPVLPFVAIEKKSYKQLFAALDQALTTKPLLQQEKMPDAISRYAWIDKLLQGAVTTTTQRSGVLTRFDSLATSHRWGKWIAIGIILVIFLLSMIIVGVLSSVASVFPTVLGPMLASGMESLHAHPILISLICDVLMNVLYFAIMMASFVLGISFGFNLLEEVGYIARVSFLFDNTMSKLGLQGKAIMPFFMGLGCTIAGASGTRVIDNWGQRVLTIALAWAVPCGATWAVMPTLATTFFGPIGGLGVIVAILAFALVFIALTAKLFGPSLAPKEQRVGMIMELPPYHKPHMKNLVSVTLIHTKDIFVRALTVITLVSIVFFALAYSPTGSAEDSIICKIGMFIEPVTRFFGLGWQTFMAFLSSMISKESLLGVLNTLYSSGTSIVGATFGAKTAGSGSVISDVLAQNISKAEALAFMFAITFNMPCVNALAATAREAHSAKWTAKIAIYYTVVALLLSCIIYHIGLLIF